MRAITQLVIVVSLLGCASRSVSRPEADAAARVRIQFVAQNDSFIEAAREYERLWASEGARIVQAMEAVSGLRFVSPVFADTLIVANVLEVASSSGYRDRSPMVMRASYPLATKRATLIHELGHRLQSGLFGPQDEEHTNLFLWIYDVWVRLYGKEFADEQVLIEKRRGRMYPQAWETALSFNAEQRAARWRALAAERLPTRR